MVLIQGDLLHGAVRSAPVRACHLDPKGVVGAVSVSPFNLDPTSAAVVQVAFTKLLPAHGGVITEFHVAPQVTPKEGLPYHEWVVAFEQVPEDLTAFANAVDEALQSRNPYYKDLIQGAVLRPAVFTLVPPGCFIEAMKQRGKLGGQNKVPRLANDRSMADLLLECTTPEKMAAP